MSEEHHHYHEDSDCEHNTFVHKELIPRKSHRGHEFDADVANDAQFISKIFQTESYNHTAQSIMEFYSDVFYVMNNKKVHDRKTVGDMLIKKQKGSACGGPFSSSNKQKHRITQEDLYILKLQAMLNLAKIQEFTSKYDINNLRLFIEMVLEESIAALHISLFHKQKEIKKYLSELRKIVISEAYLDALFLSCRLFKASFKHQNMEEPENLLNAAKRINAVFIPYVKLFEHDKNFLNKIKKGDAIVVYEKIKKILSKQNVKDISKAHSVHIVTFELSRQIKDFMNSEVQPHTRMLAAISTTNPSVTQNVEIFSPIASPTNNEGPLMELHQVPVHDEVLHAEDPHVKVTLPSVVEVQNEVQEDSPSHHSVHEEVGTAGLKPQLKISDLSQLEPSKRHEHDSFVTEHLHLTGPTPRLEFINRKDLESGECELSYVDEDQLVSEKDDKEDREGADHIPGTFSHVARSASIATRQRGASRYKPIHRTNAEPESSGLKSPMNKLTKMFSIGPGAGAGGGATARHASRRKTTKIGKKLEFESNELTDESPIKSVISKNEKLFTFDSAHHVEEPVAQPKLDEAFSRVIDIGNDYTSKWERVLNNPLITIDKIMPEGSPVVLIRAWAFVEGFTPKEVFDQIFDTEKRAKWETVTMGLSVVEMINENSQIMYFYIKTPIGITERDFVQRRNYMIDYPNKGEITMTFKSVAHEKMPPMKGRIRAETHISGYIMRPSTRAPNSTDFCIISQSDIKGSIPKMIVNSVSSKAPAEWIRKLIQACDRDRKAQQGGK